MAFNYVKCALVGLVALQLLGTAAAGECFEQQILGECTSCDNTVADTVEASTVTCNACSTHYYLHETQPAEKDSTFLHDQCYGCPQTRTCRSCFAYQCPEGFTLFGCGSGNKGYCRDDKFGTEFHPPPLVFPEYPPSPPSPPPPTPICPPPLPNRPAYPGRPVEADMSEFDSQFGSTIPPPPPAREGKSDMGKIIAGVVVAVVFALAAVGVGVHALLTKPAQPAADAGPTTPMLTGAQDVEGGATDAEKLNVPSADEVKNPLHNYGTLSEALGFSKAEGTTEAEPTPSA